MVLIQVKNGDENQFLLETPGETSVENAIISITAIYNGRLKVQRICAEMEELIEHGTLYPPEILGLTDEQVSELKLIDNWGEKCIPSGGFTWIKDPIGRRNGKQPIKKMQEVLKKTIAEAKGMISKKLILENKILTVKAVQEAIALLKGAVMIVYPMKLPPHDVIRLELENIEDLSGTQASLEVIDPTVAQLWFSGKELFRDKIIKDYTGKNEKCKVNCKFILIYCPINNKLL